MVLMGAEVSPHLAVMTVTSCPASIRPATWRMTKVSASTGNRVTKKAMRKGVIRRAAGPSAGCGRWPLKNHHRVPAGGVRQKPVPHAVLREQSHQLLDRQAVLPSPLLPFMQIRELGEGTVGNDTLTGHARDVRHQRIHVLHVFQTPADEEGSRSLSRESVRNSGRRQCCPRPGTHSPARCTARYPEETDGATSDRNRCRAPGRPWPRCALPSSRSGLSRIGRTSRYPARRASCCYARFVSHTVDPTLEQKFIQPGVGGLVPHRDLIGHVPAQLLDNIHEAFQSRSRVSGSAL